MAGGSGSGGTPPSLLVRIKERKLAPWGLAYLAVAAVVIEVSDVLGDQFAWPPALMRGLIGVAGVGFVVTLLLAWFHGRPGRQSVTGVEVFTIAAVVTIGALGVAALSDRGGASLGASLPATPATAEPSIAVLPFVSLGSGDEDALLTAGVHDQIIVQLSKIADLKILSRAAVMRAASTLDSSSSSSVARELGANYTIEGSVLRSGDRIRIHVELVETASGTNRWAESYDAAYGASELFEVQSNVATSVANALRTSLTVEERSAIEEVPTQDTEALERYTEGVALRRQATTAGILERAALRFSEATAADPEFVEAWTSLAETLLYIYDNEDESPRRLAEALEALGRAEELAPDDPRVRLVRGLYHYRAESDFQRALSEFLAAQPGLPRDPEISQSIALVQRRVGLAEESLTNFRSALELDPRNVNYTVDLALTLLLLRRFEESARFYEAALDLDPTHDWAIAGLALARLSSDPDEARRLLRSHLPNSSGSSDWAWFVIAAALGEAEWMRARVERLRTDEVVHQAAFYPRSLLRAWAEDALGNQATARDHYRSAASYLSGRFERSPDDGRIMASLGIALAGLGRAEEAIALGRRALEVWPYDRDQYLAPLIREDLAKIYALSDRDEAALDEIETLLAAPGYLTRARLAGDWVWRGLRGHPRFERLLDRS